MTSSSSSGSLGSITWPICKNDYEVGKIIGVGSTAVVHTAYCVPIDRKCAIKKINLDKWNAPMEEILKEVQAMTNCNHENVVNYYTSFVVDEELWLVIRLLECGSLLDIIKHKMHLMNCKYGVFDEVTIATVLKEVLKGLEYFHTNGQIHRDIKAGNILLGEDGTIQIADFGVSTLLAYSARDLSRQKVRHTFVGTPCWMAPEVMEQDHGYDFKADIWSFGITAIELATGNAPYYKFPSMKVLMLTLQNDPPHLETASEEKDQYKAYGKSFRKLITECLQKDPAKRPTATELLKHPFFKKAKDKKFLQQTLVVTGPSLETRAQTALRRPPGTSGRLYRKETGQWVWSSEEETEETETSDLDPIAAISASGESISAEEEPSVEEDPHAFTFVLRMREPHNQFPTLNQARQLHDIKFEFVFGKDSSEGIASELVTAGLVDSRDLIVVANNLQTLLDCRCETRTIVFKLNTAPSEAEFVDDKSLIGYAQISICD